MLTNIKKNRLKSKAEEVQHIRGEHKAHRGYSVQFLSTLIAVVCLDLD